MEEEPSRNRYISIIHEQKNNCVPDLYELETRGLSMK